MQQFRLNSLYDPDYTGVGDQPKYFDQMSLIYLRYIVYKVDVTLQFAPVGAADDAEGGNPTLIQTYYANSSMGFSPPGFGTLEDNRGTFDYVQKYTTLNKKFSIDLADLAGLSRKDYLADMYRFGGLTTGNPTETMPFWIGATRVNSASAYVNCPYWVKLDFHCKFSDLKDVAQS